MINVLSLFDGLSGGRIALERAGVKVDTYYSSEIDKYAIQIANKNYPQDEVNRLGDVTKWQDWNIDWSSIDLVTGGFPCQAWSVAGKQQGDRDERGMLFWTMLDIMKKVLESNPKAKFLIENVKMKKEFEEYITLHTSNALGVVYKHLINSSLVSAQNRQRYYWTNIYGIEQPEDKGILLRDVLEYKTGYENDIKTNEIVKTLNPKKEDGTQTYQQDRIYDVNGKMIALAAQLNGRYNIALRPCEPREYKKYSICHHTADAIDIKGNECIKRVYADSGKAPTLTTMTGGHREPKVLIADIVINQGKEVAKRNIDKSHCLMARDYKGFGNQGMTGVRYDGQHSYRKLTPLECERLQTLPDGYTEGVSNSQRFKMIGNGWTISVISHILNGLK